MLGGWKRTIQQSVRPEYVTTARDCQGVRFGKIILIDDITKTKEEVKINRKKVCKATCKNGKPCVHLPVDFENFCKRHLKVVGQV